MAASAAAPATWRGTNDSATEYCRRGNTPASYTRYQRNNSNAPYATLPSNIERTSHPRWYASGERVGAGAIGGTGVGCTTGGGSTPSTPEGVMDTRRRHSGSGSSRSDSSSPEPSDTSRASTPAAPPPLAHHANHRTPPSLPHQWASTLNGRPLAICVRNLPARSTDSSLKDGLYHEYKKHGKVVWVKVVGQSADRYAVVRFKKPSDVDKALEVSQDKLFFGCKISVAPHQNCDEDCESAKPYETDIDEYHPKATRTLFIGNLEKDVTQQQLREKFKHFGRIIEIDIKKGSGGGAGYAFCQYASISSVVEAIRAMDGEYVGGSRVKLGFGKPVATTCVWVDGLTEHTEKQVLGAVSRCGAATSVCVDRAAGAALVHFEQAAAAGAAVRELRRVAAQASAAEPAHPRLCVDYASRECQEAFYEQLEKHGGATSATGTERLPTDSRYVPVSRHDQLRYDGSGARSRAPSFGRGTSRTRYSAQEHYDPVDYAADRRYRVYDELGSSPQTDEATYEDRLQSVVVSPHRGHRHRRDSSPDERKHSKERHRSLGVASRRSRSGSRGERHAPRRRHRRRRDGSGSRAGTPLRDEPDAPPSEPRRPPRDRPPLPMSLPLPKFAVQLLRAAPPAPRQPPPPAPAPDSPPRPPSVSSSSGGSAPHSPSLEERIRSLDEKYEKWSGSARALNDAPDRTRLRHRLLEVDINEVKPSEVVRSLLAKRSVFDEDSERLEGAVRAPSPTGSPRSRGAGPLPRALRYPFPTHLPPEPDSEPDRSDRPVDPRLARADRPERPAQPDRLLKVNEADYRIEPRTRPRTPSTDKLQTDVFESKIIPSVDKERPDSERESTRNDKRRRNSCHGKDEQRSINCVDPEDILEALRDGQESETITHPGSGDKPQVGEDSNVVHKLRTCEELNKSGNDILSGSIPTGLDLPKSDLDSNSEDRTRTSWISNSKPDRITQSDKSVREVNDTSFRVCEYNSRLDLNHKDGLKHKTISETKSEETNSETKNEIERLKDSAIPNHIDKEILSFHINIPNHLNVINSIESITKPSESSHEISSERNEKQIHNHIHVESSQKAKFEKENIEHDKSHDILKHVNNVYGNTDKRGNEGDKKIDDGIITERDKTKQNKDRTEKDKYDNERDKVKTSKNNKAEKHEKEKKCKDDIFFIHKIHTDKTNKKSEKDLEKSDDKHRDLDKIKHGDEKPLRHENHRKDRHEKDKSKHSVESSESSNRNKKEEKHKYERSKKDSEVKRDSKKETDLTKSRKSSKDESSRDLCRKDSTDSSASRTSHDSTKLRDSDSNDIKEESRTKHKVSSTENFIKNEHDNDAATKTLDTTKLDPKLKVKVENIEEKDTDQHLKVRVEQNHESGLTQQKHKLENIEKQRHYSLDSSGLDSKRKERLNSCSSLPSNIGHKRRISSQDSLDCLNDENKKCRSDIKCPERRDSKDSRSTERHKSTKFNKGHFAKIIESKTKDDKKNQVKPPDETFLQLKEVDGKDTLVTEKNKNSKKSLKEDNTENTQTKSGVQSAVLQNDLDFLATLELRSSEEDERQKALRKEMKEKKRIQQLQQIQELQMQQDALQQVEIMNKIKEDKKHKIDEKKKDLTREKRMSTDRKSKDEKVDHSKRKNRKQVQSSDTSDSDEPKKHSIFDIVDDGPTYISMYDKVKARSCKNMQKQEEEKRQEKIKAKFSQLKQSRAKREEKKRSSWDEDSDSDHERRKSHKTSMDSSSEEDHIVTNNKKHDRSHMPNIDYDSHKCNDYFSVPNNEEDSKNKLSRKNSRSRIMSDTSEDDVIKRNSSKSPIFVTKIKKEIFSDSESNLSKSKDCESLPKESSDDKIKRTSLLNLFGKSDSDECKLKSSLEIENDYKVSFTKALSNEISSETESVTSNRNINEQRKKHKKKQKKQKFSFSDEEFKIDNSNDNEHKYIEKNRRHSNKKDKRKDKVRESVEAEEIRDEKNKLKKDKKSPGHCFELGSDISSNNLKKDGKMEDIFGPLSDESDKESNLPNSKLEFVSQNYEPLLGTTNEKSKQSSEDLKNKEDFKRRKERKRKEKRSFIREDDNSLDVDAVSKAIEARLFADTALIDETHIRVESIIDNLSKNNHGDDQYVNNIKSDAGKILDKHTENLKRENRDRERKKKKKRNKEDRQSRKEHHHFYHNDKDDILDKFNSYDCGRGLEIVTNSMLLDIPLPNDEQIKDTTTKSNDSLLQSPSLPRLTESPALAQANNNNDKNSGKQEISDIMIIDDKITNVYDETKCIEVHDIPMPPPFENIVQNICDVPLPKDPRPIMELESTNTESIPIPSIEIDVSSEDSNENAVRSIPNLDEDSDKHSEKLEAPTCKVDKKLEEKPRAIISQEETEDAVAALLGESFGGKADTFSNCYEEVENNPSLQTEIENTTIETENIPEEDAEEMRQAVQNLNASEMEIKPDTPVSDSDLLLIDTDTEETEETPQDAIERLPINIIATNQALNNVKSNTSKISEVSSIIITKPKSTLVHSLNPENETNIKLNEKEIKIPLIKRDSIHHLTTITTTTGTPVITTWTLSNSKLVEPQVLNLPSNSIASRDTNENKPKHITANILQIKSPQNQNVQISSPLRPVINSSRVTAPYQVINQIIRPPVSIMQPPTIKIPEPHIYQKPQGIVISPRMTTEPKLQSPKCSPQGEARTSPRLANVTVLNTTSQNLNHIGLTCPTTIQQRSPGQVTVVRMQQPPLSPLQGVAVPHTVRTMVSPNRPNSVLVQTSLSSPINFSRLPVTPVLAPISKPTGASNLIQQTKSVIPTSGLIQQQQKLQSKTGEIRKNEQRIIAENVNDTAKIILSPTRLQSNTNATVLAQNRLISMQNAVHVEKINSSLHLTNKVLITNKSDNHAQKSEDHVPFGSPPIIHVAGVNQSVAPIIQNYTKPIVCSLQQPSTINRGQNTNVIHTLNQQRVLTTAPMTSVIQLDASKVSSSVLTMATIRHPTVLTKSDSSHCTAITTSSISKVVMTPVLLKTSSKPVMPSTIKINTKMDLEHEEDIPPISSNQTLNNEEKLNDHKIESMDKHKEVIKTSKTPEHLTKCAEHLTKCETDFEELLKDKTNEIKVSNSSENKFEVNVGNPVTVLTQYNERRKSVDTREKVFLSKEDFNEGNENGNREPSLDDDKNEDIENKHQTKLDKEDKNVKLFDETTLKESDSATIIVEKYNTPSANILIDNSKLASKSETDISPVVRKKSNDDQNDIFDSLSLALEKNDREGKNLDENDYWTAKDVNIDSVIKKVDSLCNESSDLNVEKEVIISNDTDESNLAEPIIQNVSFDESELNKVNSQPEPTMESTISEESTIEKNIVTSKRGGRSFRGRKSEKIQDRVQTRQISKPARGTGISKRGRGRAKVDKKIKNLVSSSVNTIPGDVYDFHEDSGDESACNKPENRPRLILTIKSPLSGQSNATPTSTLSITQKDTAKHFEKPNKDDKVDVFASPSTNTRKSRRLQEKDVHRTTVDDVIDDVIKGSAAQPKIKDSNKKRATRQANAKSLTEKNLGSDTRKSPRGVKRTRDRSLSDASMDSNEEISRRDDVVKDAKVSKLTEPAVEPTVSCPPVFAISTSNQIQPPAPTTAHTSNTPMVSLTVSTAVSVPVSVSVATSTPAPVSVTQSISTPIMKPPKKMISEISAKLAGAFEAAIAVPVVPSVSAASMTLQERTAPPPERAFSETERSAVLPPKTAEQMLIISGAAGNVPGTMVAVGATEATDARGQSPALPHRPPSSHRPADRATPILVRGGDGDIGAGVAGVAGVVGGVRGYRGAYAGPASLPRGAHLPQHPQHPQHQQHPQLSPHSQHSPHSLAKQVPVIGSHHQLNSASRVTITSVPAVSPQGHMSLSAELVRSPPPAHQQTSPITPVYHNGERGMYPHFSHQHYQMYQQHFRATQDQCRTSSSPYPRSLEAEGSEAPTPPLELRRPAGARVPRPAHSPAHPTPAHPAHPAPAHPASVPPVAPAAPPPSDRLIMYAVGCGRSPPPTYGAYRPPSSLPPPAAQGPPHASQVPREADSLQMLLRRYPVMWQGLLALKNDSAAVQMHFVGGNPAVAADALSRNSDGTAASLLRIAQRMRLEQAQLDQVHRKMKMDIEHCMLLALPCGRDHMDVLQQSTNLSSGFITYLQRKQAAGIVNVAPTPGHQQSMYTVHIFPSCDFANENLTRIAPDLMHRVTNIAHLLIVIATATA